LGLTGASAGGHLASLVTVRNRTPVAATGVFFPLTDLIQYGSTSVDATADNGIGELVRALAFPEGLDGLSDEQIQAGLAAMSPARQVTPNAPPFLLIHGNADTIVPIQQSERLASELKKNNVPVELIVKAGGGHPWLTIHEEVRKLADWFDRQLVPQQRLSK
jgi:dipeptidyl aminopeptidase/acylaminoacyl peptidase